uniref:Uncharacterized protein n=1 Tax=Rhizophora mucronata TaxID=61149 RepID=A0A2P2PSJ6_RHIMU
MLNGSKYLPFCNVCLGVYGHCSVKGLVQTSNTTTCHFSVAQPNEELWLYYESVHVYLKFLCCGCTRQMN